MWSQYNYWMCSLKSMLHCWRMNGKVSWTKSSYKSSLSLMCIMCILYERKCDVVASISGCFDNVWQIIYHSCYTHIYTVSTICLFRDNHMAKRNNTVDVNLFAALFTGRSPFSSPPSMRPSFLGVAMSWNRGRSLSWGNLWCYGRSLSLYSGEKIFYGSK